MRGNLKVKSFILCDFEILGTIGIGGFGTPYHVIFSPLNIEVLETLLTSRWCLANVEFGRKIQESNQKSIDSSRFSAN